MKRSRSASSSSSARKRLAPLVLLALVLAAGGASAQDARVAAARREGKVVWHTALALDSAQRLATRFEQTYGVKVEVHRSGSERILQRVMQELAAGIKNADVVNTSDTGHYVLLRRKNLLARYTPAGAERFADGFRDPDSYAWGWRAFPIVVPYNTRHVAGADVPHTWKDLLEPKWKNRLVMSHPGYAGSVVTQIIALEKLYGWDFWAQLAKNRVMLVQSIHDPGRTVLSGERAAGVNGADYGLLYTDFIFTREIQQLLADGEGLYVAHPDVTYPADRPKLSELKVLVVDPDEIDRRTEDVKKRFVELFGA